MSREPNAPTGKADPIRDLWEITYQHAERLKTIEHFLVRLNATLAQLAQQRSKP